MTAEDIVDQLLEGISPARVQLLAAQFPKFTEEQIEEIAEVDPTSGGYTTWILRQLSAGKLRFPEDMEKVADRLSLFQRLSWKPGFKGERDLNRYASYGDLVKTVKANQKVTTKGELKRQAVVSGQKHLDNFGALDVYAVTTPEAAAKLFRNTEWCVKDPDYFKKYSEGLIYVTRNGEPYALLHPGSGQYMDVFDDPVSAKIVNELRPILRKFIEPALMAHPKMASKYALDVVEGRWPEAEPTIMRDPLAAFTYALDVVEGRWPEAEPTIMRDPLVAFTYALYVIKDRWPEAEPTIMKDPQAASLYALYVIKDRWPEAEPTIMKDHDARSHYAARVWPGYRKQESIARAEQVATTLLETGPEIGTLKSHQKALTADEKREAGEAPIRKSVINGRPWFWSTTHRCYQARRTLPAAVSAYWKIVEPSG